MRSGAKGYNSVTEHMFCIYTCKRKKRSPMEKWVQSIWIHMKGKANGSVLRVFYLHVCVCECMVHVCMCWRSSKEGVRPSGTGVTEDCEPPIVGGGNWTGVLGRAASILNVVLSLLPPEIKHIRRWWISVAIREVYIIVKMRLLIILEFVKKN